MKPTKQMIENEPAGPKIDAWFAELVMEWDMETIDFWCDPLYGWKPSSNIAHAMEGVEIANKNGLWVWIERPIFLNWHVTFAKGKGEIDDVIDYHAEAKELSLAITKALLLWAIEKDK